MKVEVLEYGSEDPTENWNSFKVMTVHSQPSTDISRHEVREEYEIHESTEESPVDSKRLVTAVEFQMREGGYFFVEKPNPDPDWLKEVFQLLREEDWQGHHFKEIRGNCRNEIRVMNEEDFTAVVDLKRQEVYHNRDRKAGEVTELDDWQD